MVSPTKPILFTEYESFQRPKNPRTSRLKPPDPPNHAEIMEAAKKTESQLPPEMIPKIRRMIEHAVEKLNIPQELIPPIVYDGRICGYSCAQWKYIKGFVAINTESIKQLDEKKMLEKAIFHELKHFKQTCKMIQLLGCEGYKKLFSEIQKRDPQEMASDFNSEFFSKIEKVLGRISSDSKEGKKAQSYVKALQNYKQINLFEFLNSTGLKRTKLFFTEVFPSWCRYKFNLLERDARKAEKLCDPPILIKFKDVIAKFLKQIIKLGK